VFVGRVFSRDKRPGAQRLPLAAPFPRVVKKRLDSGVVAHHRVGNQLRVYLQDVLNYAHKRSKERNESENETVKRTIKTKKSLRTCFRRGFAKIPESTQQSVRMHLWLVPTARRRSGFRQPRVGF
jgi:hypothetical protein